MKPKERFVSLRIRIILSIILALLLVTGIYSFAILAFERRGMIREAQISASHLSELIEVALQNGMMENDLSTVREMIRTLSKREGVEKIVILDKKGKVAVSSTEEDVGKTLSIADPTCQLCHQHPVRDRNRTAVINGEDNLKILRSVNPIANQKSCHTCHDPGDQVNGVLLADFSMSSYNARFGATAKMLALGGVGAIFATILVLATLVHSSVVNRLRKLLVSTKRIGEGDLSQEVEVEGNDEITELEKSFNSMTVNLRDSLKEVNESRAYLEKVINSIDDAILVVDRDYRVVTANKSWQANAGKPKDRVVGRHCYEVTHNSPRKCEGDFNQCPVEETFRTGRSTQVLHIHRNNGGEERYVEIHASPVRNKKGEIYQVVEANRDITRRKKFENQLLQSEKLISMGKLAANVAHEINNPLTGVLTFTKVIQNILDTEPLTKSQLEECQRHLNTMAEEIARCGRIVLSLLDFSRQSEPDFRHVNLNVLLDKSLVLLERMITRESIEIVKELPEDPITIMGDEHKLQQVFMNLIMNAAQAMPEGGRLTIRIRCSPGKKYSVIDFIDTGCGIPEENMSKLFDPFFTTKKEGKGLGLGLSVVYGIVAQHNGRVVVDSQVGKGTVFSVELPMEAVKAKV